MGKTPKFRVRTNEAEAAAEVEKKPSRLMPMLLAVVGLAVGAAGASGYFLFLAPPPAPGETGAEKPKKPKGPPAPPEFVDINRLTVPLVAPDGTLSGYMTLDLKFEVAPEDAAFVKARIPMMRHAINEALSRTSVADPKNPLQLDYARGAQVLHEAVNRALGREAVRSVQITTALPI